MSNIEIVICGNTGSGKTLLSTILAYFSEKKIISNYHLKLIQFEELDLHKFLRQEYENCDIFLDEGYVYLESRISNSFENRASTYILFQSRKKDVDIYITVQYFNSIDIRYRSMVNIVVFCQELSNCYKYIFYNRDLDKTIVKYVAKQIAKYFYKFYDTYEIIQDKRMLEAIKTQDEKNDDVEQYAMDIIAFYDGKKQITKDDIRLYCFKQQIPTYLINIIYPQIKEIKKHE